MKQMLDKAKMLPMNSQAKIQSIDIYPMKSLDSHSVQRAKILPCGALEGDRRWAMVDENGKYINGKNSSLLHTMKARFNNEVDKVEISIHNGDWHSIELPAEIATLERLLSKHMGRPVSVQENRELGFPDDVESPGPTLIGSASLELMTQWFPGLSVPELKRRFRANIVLETGEPFWEDRLFAAPGSARRFRVGDVELLGINPCQRCVVPSRDSLTGEVWPGFQKEFARLRGQSLPETADRRHFNHYYRFAVNTRISSENRGTSISCGDVIELL